MEGFACATPWSPHGSHGAPHGARFHSCMHASSPVPFINVQCRAHLPSGKSLPAMSAQVFPQPHAQSGSGSGAMIKPAVSGVDRTYWGQRERHVEAFPGTARSALTRSPLLNNAAAVGVVSALVLTSSSSGLSSQIAEGDEDDASQRRRLIWAYIACTHVCFPRCPTLLLLSHTAHARARPVAGYDMHASALVRGSLTRFPSAVTTSSVAMGRPCTTSHR